MTAPASSNQPFKFPTSFQGSGNLGTVDSAKTHGHRYSLNPAMRLAKAVAFLFNSVKTPMGQNYQGKIKGTDEQSMHTLRQGFSHLDNKDYSATGMKEVVQNDINNVKSTDDFIEFYLTHNTTRMQKAGIITPEQKASLDTLFRQTCEANPTLTSTLAKALDTGQPFAAENKANIAAQTVLKTQGNNEARNPVIQNIVIMEEFSKIVAPSQTDTSSKTQSVKDRCSKYERDVKEALEQADTLEGSAIAYTVSGQTQKRVTLDPSKGKAAEGISLGVNELLHQLTDRNSEVHKLLNDSSKAKNYSQETLKALKEIIESCGYTVVESSQRSAGQAVAKAVDKAAGRAVSAFDGVVNFLTGGGKAANSTTASSSPAQPASPPIKPLSQQEQAIIKNNNATISKGVQKENATPYLEAVNKSCKARGLFAATDKVTRESIAQELAQINNTNDFIKFYLTHDLNALNKGLRPIITNEQKRELDQLFADQVATHPYGGMFVDGIVNENASGWTPNNETLFTAFKENRDYSVDKPMNYESIKDLNANVVKVTSKYAKKQ